MAARSFTVTFYNWTGKTWTVVQSQLAHGIWSENGLPADIGPAHMNDDGDPQPGTTWLRSESDGVATGTEGWSQFRCDFGILAAHWANPFAGGNSFDAHGPDRYRYDWGDPGGDQASIDLHIRKA